MKKKPSDFVIENEVSDISRLRPGMVTFHVEKWDFDGSLRKIETSSRGFTDSEAQLIVDIYFKHCEHVSPEFRLDFARQLLDLVGQGKIAVTPTKKENQNAS